MSIQFSDHTFVPGANDKDGDGTVLIPLESLGYDSVDGTKISFAPDENFPKILRWIKKVNEESTLF